MKAQIVPAVLPFALLLSAQAQEAARISESARRLHQDAFVLDGTPAPDQPAVAPRWEHRGSSARWAGGPAAHEGRRARRVLHDVVRDGAVLPGALRDEADAAPDEHGARSDRAEGRVEALGALALARRVRHLKLLMIGPLDHPAEYMDLLRNELVRSDLQEHVQFLGFREDVADLYAVSDVVLVCGQDEALPLCAIEAGVSSRPVVACGASGATEIINHGVNGLMVRDDPESIADALMTLARSSEVRTAMGLRGRQVWQEKFSAERCASRTLALYEELVSRSRPIGQRVWPLTLSRRSC